MVPEATLLAGYIELADCKFEAARKHFDALAADVRPLVDAILKLRASGPARQAILSRALERAARRGPSAVTPALANNADDRVLAMLRLDPAIVRLSEALAGLKREAQVAPHAIDEWRDLLYRVATRKGQVATNAPEGAARLLSDVRRLREDVLRERAALVRGGDESAPERLPQLDHAAAELAELEGKIYASSADADPALKARMEKDLAQTTQLAERTRALADGFDAKVDDLAQRELIRVQGDLVRIFEKARLGKVDAVIGEKRLLEKEIEQISSDTYLPRTIGRAFQQGLIGDTEEYWPPEAEVWEDEYDRWK
jgi:hypothetical protein